jgi:hypothetical protein
MRVFPGPSCLIRLSFTKLGGMKINAQVRETLTPEDSVRQVARRANSKRLRSQRLKRLVEGDPELACLRVTDAERS